MKHPYGHFHEDGMAFVVTDPATPRAFDNFIWNDSVMSCVQQTGVGYCDVQIGDTEGIKLYTGEGRICDIEVFGRETLLSRLIYVRDNETGEFWNVGWEPVRRAYEAYACEHGLGYSRIQSTTKGVASSLLMFVPPGREAVEMWKLALANPGARRRSLTVFVYNQYGLQYKSGFKSYGDMIYRGAWFEADHNAMIIQKHPQVAPHAFLTGFLTADRKADGYDGSRDGFVGIYNTLSEPQAVVAGKCTNRPGSSEATVGVLQFNLMLEPGQEEKIHLISGLTDAPDRLTELRPRLFASFDAQFAALKAEKAKMVAHNEITTPDEHFNRMANGWLKQQTLYGATWGRWGWMGYRDVVQHAWGIASFDAPRTRRVFLAALARQYRNGLALRGWNPLDTKVYSDSALWLVATACDYLKETGDFALLEQKVPYHDEGEDTVWGHLRAALEFLENNKGKHDLCLIKFGDWNDSLTAIGKAGRGESIWLSMAYVRGLVLMAELGQRMGRTGEAAAYTARAEAMRKAIRTHAWDGQWFLRCFDDEGRPVGSNTNEQGRIFVNAQSWAMLSGVADEHQMAALLKSCDELLMTDIGYRLVAPPYMKRDDYIGRISYLEPGICENGTIYSHGNAFMIYALLQQGQGDRAYALFQRAASGYLPDASNPKAGAPPYIFSNCYYGPEHRNRPFQMEFTWVTGSVSWFANAILDYQVGVRREYDGLTLDPVLPSAWNEVRVNRTFRGKTFNVLVRRTGQRSLTVNGRAVSGRYIPLSDCGASNEVQVTI
jgi:cellobiose phosphorylase